MLHHPRKPRRLKYANRPRPAPNIQPLFNPRTGSHSRGPPQTPLQRNSRFKIATGFAGTLIVRHALTEINETHLFTRMLYHHHKAGSWLYQVTMGATTPWERWDSMLPDGSVNPGEMTSFNH
ncbi:hypothetical protein ASPCAL10631 [Aspergillus calidoustus]|uniref:Alpha-L-rhamnosidase six-hairpin glycosidase domain-containing protein n=1 Tax=Aspergillus calidoustus TaxID=454130 RepID=A0A0U5G5V0_ASPCI|nr:hypothetical protein ASPCAL10631 [Aspergillus calidoustus]